MGVRIINLSRSVFGDNDAEADVLREELFKKGVFLINVMSSPGAGKTTTLVNLIKRLSSVFRIGVMEADIDYDIDAVTVAKTGCKSIQLHTGGMCHLDVAMTRQGVEELGIDDLDIVFLENVGNLVCPAEFDTGANFNVTILSVPEGVDKPLKYPLVFQKSDLVIINKIDVIEYFNYDLDACIENIGLRNKNATVIPVSAKTGDNMEKVAEYIINTVTEWRKGNAQTKR